MIFMNFRVVGMGVGGEGIMYRDGKTGIYQVLARFAVLFTLAFALKNF